MAAKPIAPALSGDEQTQPLDTAGPNPARITQVVCNHPDGEGADQPVLTGIAAAARWQALGATRGAGVADHGLGACLLTPELSTLGRAGSRLWRHAIALRLRRADRRDAARPSGRDAEGTDASAELQEAMPHWCERVPEPQPATAV